jgi:hypothetical protein
MYRNWRYIFLPLLSLFIALTVSHPAFAFWWFPFPLEKPNPRPYNAPEMDPKLAIEGLAVAGTAAVLLWERIKRRR